ncbi:MAG: hypothetical protein AAF170_04720 [Bacteroidota bacterium]
MLVRVAILLGIALPLLLSARPEDRMSVDRMSPGPLVEWIVALQERGPESEGALAMHADASFVLDGEGSRHVVPYFSNLAVAALLEADPSPRSREVAELWIDWFLDRVGPEGVPVEHWVGMKRGLELTCPARFPTQPSVDRCEAIDATDSAASTFLILLAAYHRAGGSEAFLRQREVQVREVAQTLLDLQDTDGLTIARTDYPVKYLMDNAETVAGLRAVASLDHEVFEGEQRAVYKDAADRAADGLATLLDPETGLYAWAKLPDDSLESARLDRWYADAVAQVWPLVFEVTDAIGGYRQLDAAWDGSTQPDWALHRDASGFAWPVLGLAAHRAGDRAAAQRQADALWQRHVGSRSAGPFTVADAGWLLRTVAALEAG